MAFKDSSSFLAPGWSYKCNLLYGEGKRTAWFIIILFNTRVVFGMLVTLAHNSAGLLEV